MSGCKIENFQGAGFGKSRAFVRTIDRDCRLTGTMGKRSDMKFLSGSMITLCWTCKAYSYRLQSLQKNCWTNFHPKLPIPKCRASTPVPFRNLTKIHIDHKYLNTSQGCLSTHVCFLVACHCKAVLALKREGGQGHPHVSLA